MTAPRPTLATPTQPLAPDGARPCPVHAASPAEVAAWLNVDPHSGLSSGEALTRLKASGPNLLDAGPKRGAFDLLLVQFRNPLLLILFLAALISAITGHVGDAVAIATIAIINAVVSFVQDFQAEKSMAALARMAAPQAVVRREGAWQDLPAADLVPGDIVRLKAGDIVPADLRLTEAARLQIEEAALTGESEPVDKAAELGLAHEAVLADRLTMAYSGTQVVQGTGIGIVTATGMATEVGQIAHLLAETEEPPTLLQQRMGQLSKVLILAAFAVVALTVAIGLFNGLDPMEMFNTAISLSVAAIPEGLPTIVTIVLTIGSRTMARQSALVRRLASVETLGATTVICTDKTGTLTQNQMQVMRIWTGLELFSLTGEGFDPQGAILDQDDKPVDPHSCPGLMDMLSASVLCNEADLVLRDGKATIQGNPTEGALVVAGAKAGLDRDTLMDDAYSVLAWFPFDSRRKMMSVHLARHSGREILMTKGAPDVILPRATHLWLGGEAVPLTPDLRAEVEGVVRAFGEDALRTLAVAWREASGSHINPDDPEKDLVLLGIHGIMDPPRRQVGAAVHEARDAGVRTVMITGDHAHTADAIARQIGILHGPGQTTLTGPDLDGMDDAALREAVSQAAVFARVTPQHKLRIVSALQERGEVTAMTGDGVNDAPALRKADIGIAMGITGTAVAKTSAALILLDDNFATIVAAVRHGRRIYDNLRKYIRQALTANVAEVSTILLAFLVMGADAHLPLTPLMILWVNLVSDGVPALTLGFEPGEGDLMRRPPRLRSDSVFADGLKYRILSRGLAVGAVSFLVFHQHLAQGAELAYAQTMGFAALIFAQLWHIFDARTNVSLFASNPFGNRNLLIAVVASLVLSAMAIYTPFGQEILHTRPVGAGDLFEAFALASLPTLLLAAVNRISGGRIP